jgi:hypothetical protein
MSHTQMKLIAHRGLFNGPDKQLENTVKQIDLALSKGYDSEIDVWYDDEWYLGHDEPKQHIEFSFLMKPGLWIHVKNIDALYMLRYSGLNYFWHQNDDYTLTSQGYIWTYPGNKLTSNSICVLPEWDDPSLSNVKNLKCFGICSDFVGSL